MKTNLILLMCGALACVSCVAALGPHGTSVAIAPPLPAVVALVDPFYVHGGYRYYYHQERWYFAAPKGGGWIDLPRDRYPREVRFKKGQGHGYRDHDRHPDGDRYRGPDRHRRNGRP
jgi:hypothetical protein